MKCRIAHLVALAASLALCWTPPPCAGQSQALNITGFETGETGDFQRVFGLGASCLEGPVITSALDGSPGAVPAGSFQELACLEVFNDRPRARGRELAWSAIPIARDLGLTSTDALIVAGSGQRRLEAQFDVLARWGGPVDDTSLPIRWLQVVFPAHVGAGSANNPAFVRVALRRMETPASSATPFAASITPVPATSRFMADTGLATFELDAANPALFHAIGVNPNDIDSATRIPVYSHVAGAGPYLSFDNGGTPLTLSTATPGQVTVDAGSFRILENGPAKVTVALDGHFSSGTGASLCTSGPTDYERFGYTLVATFQRASRHVLLEFHLRNECSDANSGPWTDDAVTVHRASWELPLGWTQVSAHAGGAGAVTTFGAGTVDVEQRKGTGSPWQRRARIRLNSVDQQTAQAFDRPVLAIQGQTAGPLGGNHLLAALNLAWMRYREPQAIVAQGSTLSLRVISESLVVGEGKGLWNQARLSLLPGPSGGPFANAIADVEALRTEAVDELERGLLVRTYRSRFDRASVLPTLGAGTGTPSATETTYLQLLGELHGQTVGAAPNGQWHRAKTFGSQLWPDVQRDLWLIDNPDPASNSGAMNYWNPSGTELLEFLRSGHPRWAWDFALPQSWLQTHTAYLNIGNQSHGNRAGVAVTSGGSGEGQWHRSAFGSDDYSYNQGLQLAYLLRPSPALRDRFRQAGITMTNRYSLPQAQQGLREAFVDQVDITRQVIQHFEMLANCAEFVPGAAGQACHDRLQEILAELGQDNLRAGLLCQGDIPNANTCDQPQQFMQNAMHFLFFHRMLRNYGDFGGLQRSLIEAPLVYYQQGMMQGPGGAIDVNADWAALMSCSLTGGGTQVNSCTWFDNGDGLSILGPNRPHTIAWLLQAHELDPTATPAIDLCTLGRAAFDNPSLAGWWADYLGNASGWWKGADQMFQGLAFGFGAYERCGLARVLRTGD